jgi:hypothetical protein
LQRLGELGIIAIVAAARRARIAKFNFIFIFRCVRSDGRISDEESQTIVPRSLKIISRSLGENIRGIATSGSGVFEVADLSLAKLH